jgi:hypothetical protein
MSTETIVLLSNANDDSQPSSWQYSDKNRGAGYYKNGNGLHTAVFEFDNFKGGIKLQATLALYPNDNDWFDIIYDSADVVLTAIDSTPITSNATCTFTGKFVFIRAAYMLEEGTITEIRYNY